MITFTPIDALFCRVGTDHVSRFYSDTEWLLIAAHFAQRYYDPRQDREGQEWNFLNAAVNVRSFEGFRVDHTQQPSAGQQARTRLANTLKHVGLETTAGLFLWRIGIRTTADLFTSMQIPGRAFRWPLEWWGNQRARWFRKPGPNRHHPEARWVTDCRLSYRVSRGTWSVGFGYDYPHDGGSSWAEGVSQGPREGLESFGDRVTKFIEDRFEPEDRNGSLYRPDHERKWERVKEAMEALFPWAAHVPPDYGKQIADILAAADGTVNSCGRFDLTPQRLGLLKRWAREAVAASKKKDKP